MLTVFYQLLGEFRPNFLSTIILFCVIDYPRSPGVNLVSTLTMLYSNINLLIANPTKWSNTLKQFVGNLQTNCLSVFDHFVKLALKGLKILLNCQEQFHCGLFLQHINNCSACDFVRNSLNRCFIRKHFEFIWTPPFDFFEIPANKF